MLFHKVINVDAVLMCACSSQAVHLVMEGAKGNCYITFQPCKLEQCTERVLGFDTVYGRTLTPAFWNKFL